jgi:hypothetical protein
MNSGIYELTCATCNRSYVEQTSRTWKQRYQENLKYIKQNDPQSTYALHVLNSSSEFGPIINTMPVHKRINEGPLLRPFKQLYIRSQFYHSKHVWKQNTEERNPMHQLIFDLHIQSP